MDYIEIRVAKDYDDTQSETLVMRGFVDSTNTSVSATSDGTPQVYCEISGRDYGKLLLRALFVTLPGTNLGEPITGDQQSKFLIPIGAEMGMAIGSTEHPATYARELLKAVEGSVTDSSGSTRVSGIMSIPPGAPKLNLNVDPPLDSNYLIYNDGQTPFTGSVWNALQYYQSAPFFELFVTDDVIGTSSNESINASQTHPTIVWRRAPYRNIYNQTAADDAQMVFPDAPNIRNRDIASINVGRSDAQQFSYFLCYPTYGGFTGDSMWYTYAPPVTNGGAAYWDEKLTRRFGFTELEGQLAVSPMGTTQPLAGTQTTNDSNKDAAMPLMRKYSKWLYDVYQSNYLQLSGTITIPGDPAYRVGRHTLMEDAKITFYIEGVDHDFQIGLNTISFTTSLTVTRGQYPDGMSPYEVIAGPEPDLGLNSFAVGSGTPPPVFGGPPSTPGNPSTSPSSQPVNCSTMDHSPFGPNATPAITQGYGPTSEAAEPIHNGVHFHEGIDFAAHSGTPLYAVGAGTVIHAGTGGVEPGIGSYVVIQLANGSTVRYGHMDPSGMVAVGTTVSAGQQIGLSDNTFINTPSGPTSTGPHLHLAVYDANGNSVDISSCFSK